MRVDCSRYSTLARTEGSTRHRLTLHFSVFISASPSSSAAPSFAMGNVLPSRLIQQERLDFAVYEAACISDADVRAFNENLRDRTGKVLHAIATGVEDSTLSFSCLKEVTTSLVEMDHDVMEVILQYKDEAWKNHEIFLLVKEFFENSLATLDFCTATDSAVKNAKQDEFVLEVALRLMPTDNMNPTDSEMQRILAMFETFVQAGDPFGDEFILKFKAVQERHLEMLKMLKEKKRRLDKKLKHVRLWSTVSCILFGAVVAAVLIGSVVAAAFAVPHLAPALAAACSSVPIGTMGAWMRSAWKNYEKEIRAKRGLVQSMHISTFVIVNDLATIRNLVVNVKTQMIAVVSNIELCHDHPDVVALRVVAESISLKRAAFVSDLDNLQEHIKALRDSIVKAREIVLTLVMANQGRYNL